MPTKKISVKTWVIVLIVLVLLVVVVSQLQKGQAPVSQTPGGNGISNIGASIPANPTAPGTSNSTNTVSPTSKTQSSAILSPAANAIWILNASHTISWTRSVGVTGSAYLLNAADKSLVGYILQTVQPNQTSFIWDTQYLFATRTSPTKQNVMAGLYVIKVQFDKSQGSLESGPFSIVYPNQIQNQNFSVSIKNLTFDQTALNVIQGNAITITNNDTVTHSLSLSGLQNQTLAPGQSWTVNTSVLNVGNPYSIYSTVYPSLRLTITIKAAQN